MWYDRQLRGSNWNNTETLLVIVDSEGAAAMVEVLSAHDRISDNMV